MTDTRPGGRRRLDRVLAEDYLTELSTISLSKVRAKVHYVQAEESELAFLLSLLRDRITTIESEQRLRLDSEYGPFNTPASVFERGWSTLVKRFPKRRYKRSLPPSRKLPPRNRRRVERLLHDVDLTDIHNRTDDELTRVLKTFQQEERQISEVHERVRDVAAQCLIELAHRVRGVSWSPHSRTP